MVIDIPDEMYERLMQMSYRVNSQNHRFTSMPYIFQVSEDHKVYDTGLNGDYKVLFTNDFDCEIPSTKEGIIDFCNDNDFAPPKDDEIDDYLNGFSSIEFDDWMEEHGLVKSSYNLEKKYSNAFFSEKACEEHIAANRHNYNNPKSYLRHALRNPEMELVYMFICGLTGERIHR